MVSGAASAVSRARVCKLHDPGNELCAIEYAMISDLINQFWLDLVGFSFEVAGFRRLNRARIQLFRGDDHAMKVSRAELRAQMEANRSIPTSGPVFEELVKGMDEAVHMLRHEIVRGDLNQETGRYGRFSRVPFH